MLIRRLAALGVVFAGILGGTVLVSPERTLATTGPTHFLPDSKYKVASALEALYVGQYKINTSSTSAEFSGGAMGIELNDDGFLDGVVQFYTYDTQGKQTSWVGTLYNFRLATNKKDMVLDVLGPTGHPLLGHMTVTRSKSGSLTGEMTLSTGSIAISWQKISNI